MTAGLTPRAVVWGVFLCCGVLVFSARPEVGMARPPSPPMYLNIELGTFGTALLCVLTTGVGYIQFQGLSGLWLAADTRQLTGRAGSTENSLTLSLLVSLQRVIQHGLENHECHYIPPRLLYG